MLTISSFPRLSRENHDHAKNQRPVTHTWSTLVLYAMPGTFYFAHLLAGAVCYTCLLHGFHGTWHVATVGPMKKAVLGVGQGTIT